MSQGTQVGRYTNDFLQAVMNPHYWWMVPGTMQPNTIYPRGTCVGRVTSASAADRQTVSFDATPASGSWYLQVAYVNRTLTSIAIAWSASAGTALARVQAALDAMLGTGNATVTGTYGGGFVITRAGTQALGPMPLFSVVTNTLATSLAAQVNASVAHTIPGVKKGAFEAYASGNSDGSQIPVGFLEMACATDENGNITFGDTVNPGTMQGGGGLAANVVVQGFLDCSKLSGTDSNALTLLGARIIDGAVPPAAGVLVF